MTSYHGGKQRIGKKLAEIIVNKSIAISEDTGFEIKGYCEPFCGMLGVYQHIPELFEDEGYNKLKYKAGDQNKSLIMMWKAAQNDELPNNISVSKTSYNKLRHNGESSPTKGFIGHTISFRGIYFSQYDWRVPAKVIKNNLMKIKTIAYNLSDVKFTQGSYLKFSNLKNYIIYCDPPYEKTEQRYYDEEGNQLKFDSEIFWNWCRKMSKNNIVFVSSYTAPRGFKKIWSKDKEKLFLLYKY